MFPFWLFIGVVTILLGLLNRRLLRLIGLKPLVEVNTCGAENADITFWYGSHKDRIAIEKVIGSDTFFGIPYNLQNR